MKRHSFALTILLASLAAPLLTVGSARCQSGAPNYRNQCEVCPMLDDYCNDYYYYGDCEIAAAEFDEQLDPRFDPETGRYIGHDEAKTVQAEVETAATDADLEAFYAACEDTCNVELESAYASETVIDDQQSEELAEAEVIEADRYDEEYYDDYSYDYEYENYDYEYQAEDYWYEEAAAEDVTTEETVNEVEAETEVATDESYEDSYDYDYGYDEYDNYDYEYETYDYEAYDYEPGPEVRDYEAEVAAEYAAAEAAKQVIPTPPVVAEEILAAEKEAMEAIVAAEAWDHQTEGYDPYAYDYEAYEYEYEVYENGAVATPVAEDEVADEDSTEQLTSEHEADFAETWTDETDSVEEYTEEEYSYEYDYDYDYETQTETAEVETVNPVTPLTHATTRQALLSAAHMLDSLSNVLKNASAELERTASLESNIR